MAATLGAGLREGDRDASKGAPRHLRAGIHRVSLVTVGEDLSHDNNAAVREPWVEARNLVEYGCPILRGWRLKVVVTGTFSSGKTTLCNDLVTSSLAVHLVEDYCRPVLDLMPGIDWTIPAVRDHLIVNQVLIEAFAQEQFDLVVVDGGITNNIGHDRGLLGEAPDRRELLGQLNFKPYDLVVYCSPVGVPLYDDGQRYTDSDLQTTIDRHIRDAIHELGHGVVVDVAGDRQTRLDVARRAIEDVGKAQPKP